MELLEFIEKFGKDFELQSWQKDFLEELSKGESIVVLHPCPRRENPYKDWPDTSLALKRDLLGIPERTP